MTEAENIVTALYRGLLGRDPDVNGLATHAGRLSQGAPLDDLARRIVSSPEFAEKFRANAKFNRHPFDAAPPLPIELDVSPADEKRLWAHIERCWSMLGTVRPHFSVITNQKWRDGQISDEDEEKFYASGQGDLRRLDAWLARNGVTTDHVETCVEFGCGLARHSIWLARRYPRVVALDISEPHLALARKKAAAEGLTNIEFVHVQSRDDLRRVQGADLFFSHIVLQHNPPPLIAEILDQAFAGMRPRGLAFFQVPTYGAGYAFNLKAYLDDMQERGMETHVFPQRAVFDVAWRYGVRPLEVQPDNALGGFDRWISSCFLMEKTGGRPR